MSISPAEQIERLQPSLLLPRWKFIRFNKLLELVLLYGGVLEIMHNTNIKCCFGKHDAIVGWMQIAL